MFGAGRGVNPLDFYSGTSVFIGMSRVLVYVPQIGCMDPFESFGLLDWRQAVTDSDWPHRNYHLPAQSAMLTPTTTNALAVPENVGNII